MNEMVSVIIPVFNTARFLDKCISSVVTQTYNNIEILAVDDGSTDESVKVLYDLQKTFSRMRIFEEPHKGVSAARNVGINNSLGEFLFFLDSDDYIEDGLIESLMTKIDKHKADIGISYLRRFGAAHNCDAPVVLERDYYCPEEIYEAYGKINVFGAIGGKLISRDLIGEIRFDSRFASAEDTLFIYELIKREPGVVISDDYFYKYRIHANNKVSEVSAKRIEDMYTVYKYIYDTEDAFGRERVAFQWFSNLMFFLSGLIGNDYSFDGGRKVRRILKRRLCMLRKEKYYRNISSVHKIKINLFVFGGIALNKHRSDDTLCTGCGACADICPNNCISIKVDKYGFRRAVVDGSKCINCGKCKRICPANVEYDNENISSYYALKASESDILASSTSGGAFRLIAGEVIKQGGIVIGCALADGKVKHIAVDEAKDIIKLVGSKYAESDTSGIYEQALDYLKSGRKVLFSGTPCQVEAMRRIAGNQYNNLYLADLICNGIASADMWKKYVATLEHKYRDKLVDFKFRDKRNKDDGHSVTAVFTGRAETWSMYSDPFLKSYFVGNNLRTECTACRFCHGERKSDITLGDFWGVERKYPSMNDGMGTSLVIVHSEHGFEMFNAIKDKAITLPLLEREARQPRLLYPFTGKKWRPVAGILYRWLPFGMWIKLFGR